MPCNPNSYLRGAFFFWAGGGGGVVIKALPQSLTHWEIIFKTYTVETVMWSLVEIWRQGELSMKSNGWQQATRNGDGKITYTTVETNCIGMVGLAYYLMNKQSLQSDPKIHSHDSILFWFKTYMNVLVGKNLKRHSFFFLFVSFT